MPKSASDTLSPALLPEPVSYEQALVELDRLVQAIESAQQPLDELLDSYRRGAQLLACCRDRLATVEQQVKVLGHGLLQPWNDPS